MSAFGGAAFGAGVTIDGAQTYQTIEGFGVNANHRSWNTNDLQPVLDALIDQAGMTLFRVVFDNTDWEGTNDNSNPDVMNWDYYNPVYRGPDFQKLWDMMGYLNQKGITNGVMVNFQGPGPDWMGYASLTAGYEDEWAEMIASALVYARYTNHLQFGLVGPNNEPDLPGTGIGLADGLQYGTTLHKLAQQLDANGMSDVRFVGPDLSTSGTNWLPEIMSDPLVMTRLAHFGLHSYSAFGGFSDGVADFIAHSAYPDRTFWMTEFNVWCDVCQYGTQGTNSWEYSRGTAENLLYHLANNASAGLVWEAYDSHYYNTYDSNLHWSFWGLFALNDINAAPPVYTPRKNFYTVAQISKFVRPGARRIDVSGSSSLLLLAFYHPDTGQLTLTGVNSDPSPAALAGTLASLPAISNLDLYYTSSSANLYHGPGVPITNGAFAVTLPPDCVFTLTGFDPAKTVSVSITNPVDGARYIAPAKISLQASVATPTGSISRVEFFTGASKIGESSVAPYSITWSNVGPGTYTLSARATNSAGNGAVSPDVHVTVSSPVAEIRIIPTNATVLPYASQQFAATALDSFGNTLQPQPALAWSVSGGGTIDSNGLFTAGGSSGGPYSVGAGSGGVSGAASIYVSPNVNLAPAGQGYTWYGLTASTGDTPRVVAAGINDGDLATDVYLTPAGAVDDANAYEAAGVVWPAPQTIGLVIYNNGSYTPDENGVFAADFKLQFSPDGTLWNDAGPEWTNTPAYSYNSPASAGASFSFSGGAVAARGVRCVGQVRTAETSPPPNSWVAAATEVRAFSGQVAAPPPPVLRARAQGNGVGIFWPGALTNYLVESAGNLNSPVTWLALTNMPAPVGNEQRIIVVPAAGQQFFRLRKQ